MEGNKQDKKSPTNPIVAVDAAVKFSSAGAAALKSPTADTIVSPRENNLRSSIKGEGDKKTPRDGSNDKEYITVLESHGMKKENYTNFKKFVKKR